MFPALRHKLSRREFIHASAIALAATGLRAAETRSPKVKPRFKIIGFIKPFQLLPFDQLADITHEVGWDGIECPVRKDGAIEPKDVEDRLPKLVETLRKRDLELPVISTDVEDAVDPPGLGVLKTASKLGIRRYRLKHYYYDLDKPIAPQIENFAARLRDLVPLNKELNLQGSVQNHSGRNYLGAPVWDIWEMIRALDPNFMGVFFDIGHATVEGGSSWPIEAKLMEPFFSVVSVKDFRWQKSPNGDWRADWCPLGEGMVSPHFFDFLRKTAFNGPISLHFEYPLGKGKDMVAAIKKDVNVLKRWIGEGA